MLLLKPHSERIFLLLEVFLRLLNDFIWFQWAIWQYIENCFVCSFILTSNTICFFPVGHVSYLSS